MKKVVVILVIVAVVTALSVAWYRSRRDASNASELVLHGNIDLRQVDLAFNGSQRIAAVLVEEGDRVEAGQVVGYLEMDRLKPPKPRQQHRSRRKHTWWKSSKTAPDPRKSIRLEPICNRPNPI